MKALCIHAGPQALRHIGRHGLAPSDVAVIPAAAGGPKGLILGPLDRFLFGEWLAQSAQPVDLIGASIGAWRMATACLDHSLAAFVRLEHDYIHQEYELPPGARRPTADAVSAQFGQNLQAFFGGRVDTVLGHARYRLHIIAARGRHLLAREHRWGTPLGYLGAFASNALHRRALALWLDRVVFSTAAPGALPFDVRDFRTHQVALTAQNFMPALQASCSIPFVLRAVHDIAGAPRGAYWDGGIIDYHLHLRYQAPIAIENIADTALPAGAAGQNGLESAPGIVLYPHFQHRVVPGWMDKGLPWRHRATPALDRMVLLSPHPDWVRSLPGGKLPDRTDFTRYGTDTAARARAWSTAAAAAQQLADEWAQWLRRPDPARVQPL